MQWLLVHLVERGSHAGLLVGCGVAVEDTLGHGLVQGAGCHAQLLLSSSLIASGNGLAELADLGTDGGANALVAAGVPSRW